MLCSPSQLLVALRSLLVRRDSDRGQSTVEYALVLVGVAALAVFVFSWLQGSGLLEEIFGSIFRRIVPR